MSTPKITQERASLLEELLIGATVGKYIQLMREAQKARVAIPGPPQSLMLLGSAKVSVMFVGSLGSQLLVLEWAYNGGDSQAVSKIPTNDDDMQMFGKEMVTKLLNNEKSDKSVEIASLNIELRVEQVVSLDKVDPWKGRAFIQSDDKCTGPEPSPNDTKSKVPSKYSVTFMRESKEKQENEEWRMGRETGDAGNYE